MSWGKPETAKEQIITTLLQPAATAYGLGSYLRLRAYGAGYLKRHKADVPVVSVGNLTCGGTGKTPVVVDLARRLVESGYKVSILSRGYKRKSREELLVVSDGKGSIVSCADAGDEPYMMARAVPEASVIVCAKRSAAAQVAVNVYDADVILLDDGFQHLAIERDQDVVLIDYNDDPLRDSLLPAGRLREPVSALTRADWIVITRIPANPSAARLSYLEEILRDRAERAQITRCRFVPHCLRLPDGTVETLTHNSLAGAKVVALSGIARPASFAELLTELKADVVRQRAFPDHYWWRQSDFDSLRTDLAETGADLVVTTEKDFVRMDPDACRQLPIKVLELKTEWLGPVPVLSVPPFVFGKHASENEGGKAKQKGGKTKPKGGQPLQTATPRE